MPSLLNRAPSRGPELPATFGEGDARPTFGEQLVALRSDLYKRALSLTHERATAEDLVQDVIERALRARERFKDGTNLLAWLSTIQRNIFIDDYRQSRMVSSDVEPAWQATEPECKPLDVLSMHDLTEATETLADDDRRILELAHREDLSYRQIAAILGVLPSTVGTRLFRVRQKLRPALLILYWKRLRQTGAAKLDS
jgi:RNA polymerase sigma-70 factor (ECF subfamily)